MAGESSIPKHAACMIAGSKASAHLFNIAEYTWGVSVHRNVSALEESNTYAALTSHLSLALEVNAEDAGAKSPTHIVAITNAF
jgi:hypothetical protein